MWEVAVSRIWLRISIFALSVVSAGCVSAPPVAESYSSPVPPRAIVLVLDGAGGFPEASNSIMRVVDRTRMPVSVRRYEWSHGMGRGLADMVDTNHSQQEARRLAADINWYRANYPAFPVVVVGYSAGAFVSLEAMRFVPPGSVDNLVLIAPAVAANYNLGPALLASRRGIDVFSSEQDTLFLGLGTAVVGTADGKNGVPPAGRVGFDMQDPRIRDHAWNPSVAWTGNHGSHSGPLQPDYLKAYVLPTFLPPTAPF